MLSRPFDNPHAGRFSASPVAQSYQMSSAAALPMLRPRVRDLHAESEWPPEAVVDIRVLGKGVAWALAIEGTAAMFISVIWHLCRILL